MTRKASVSVLIRTKGPGTGSFHPKVRSRRAYRDVVSPRCEPTSVIRACMGLLAVAALSMACGSGDSASTVREKEKLERLLADSLLELDVPGGRPGEIGGHGAVGYQTVGESSARARREWQVPSLTAERFAAMLTDAQERGLYIALVDCPVRGDVLVARGTKLIGAHVASATISLRGGPPATALVSMTVSAGPAGGPLPTLPRRISPDCPTSVRSAIL